MSRIDLSAFAGGDGNGYIVEEHSSVVVQEALRSSAIEAAARRENMGTTTKLISRFFAEGPSVYAEGDQILEAGANLDSIILEAKKWAKIMHISEEDLNDTFIDVLNKYKTEWASRWAKSFDMACLGATSVDAAASAPYTSVYKAVADSTEAITPTNGDVTFKQLSDALAVIEQGNYFNPAKVAFIAHPTFMQSLRNLQDDNHRPILQQPLGPTSSTLFGYPVIFSQGAVKANVSGGALVESNPLLVVGNTDLMVNGVRAGIESAVSRDAKFDTDGVLLKVRARRAFAVADPSAFAILEKTAD